MAKKKQVKKRKKKKRAESYTWNSGDLAYAMCGGSNRYVRW